MKRFIVCVAVLAFLLTGIVSAEEKKCCGVCKAKAQVKKAECPKAAAAKAAAAKKAGHAKKGSAKKSGAGKKDAGARTRATRTLQRHAAIEKRRLARLTQLLKRIQNVARREKAEKTIAASWAKKKICLNRLHRYNV
ncbi:MAG: hypothetical protein DRP66_05315 [Planctomycetota bacterium]|nr:MAG: hypothetical protein DRP66_05315 [Planctomycetota bacterium]